MFFFTLLLNAWLGAPGEDSVLGRNLYDGGLPHHEWIRGDALICYTLRRKLAKLKLRKQIKSKRNCSVQGKISKKVYDFKNLQIGKKTGWTY